MSLFYSAHAGKKKRALPEISYSFSQALQPFSVYLLATYSAASAPANLPEVNEKPNPIPSIS